MNWRQKDSREVQGVWLNTSPRIASGPQPPAVASAFKASAAVALASAVSAREARAAACAAAAAPREASASFKKAALL
jgi:hypothetical protein